MERAEPSNRPPADDFHQQKLRAWQPILTPWHVITLFVAIGVAFIPTGVHLLQSSNDVSYLYSYSRNKDSYPLRLRSMNPSSPMMDRMLLLIAPSRSRTRPSIAPSPSL